MPPTTPRPSPTRATPHRASATDADAAPSPADTAAAAARVAGPALGLRGRKRERTRRAIIEAAFGLFAEHGFDAVRTTEIAAAADVSPATVFTHFATKEDIFFSRRSVFLDRIPEAVASAATGPALLDRLREGLSHTLHHELTDERAAEARTTARILLDSQHLRRGYLRLIHTRESVLTAALLQRAGERADATELALFASFVVAIASRGFEAKDEALAAGRSLPAIRKAVDDILDHGFARLARAYEADAALDPT